MKQLCSLFRNSLLLTFVSCAGLSAQQKLNETQVIGTHNSYKVAIDRPVMDTLKTVNPGWAQRFDYSHEPIDKQLAHGLSNLELDIAVDRQGGKYAHPAFYEQFKEKYALPVYNEDGEMNKPGFKVLHVQDLDFRSHCGTLSQCLTILKSWSDANPAHHPVFITMNAKDNATNGMPTVPDKFSPEDFRMLDKQILGELGRDKLLLPADVQGNYPTLEEAVLKKGWPDLEKARGRFIFILDEKGEKRAAYLNNGSPVQVFFADSPEGDPHAAIMIMNDPKRSFDRITALVKKGYIIRTRADADTFEARKNDFSRFKAACESGAQIITTDYYQKSKHFKSDYFIQFPGGKYVRKNPVLVQK
ncbi:phosphatidylinositol-specific phospholipase C1-like protein [Leadbetterella sp. DM7]|uniref:phosphatidylinositol-specific phospholipase C1-like protein n=1 Tax=Leadbetterella sp. DM7 TaxID=3235085 RepID=UPI00349E8015